MIQINRINNNIVPFPSDIKSKLENPSYFMSTVNERVKFKINGGDKEKGLMTTADEKGFTIEKKGEDVRYEYCNILKAKTYYKWNKTINSL